MSVPVCLLLDLPRLNKLAIFGRFCDLVFSDCTSYNVPCVANTIILMFQCRWLDRKQIVIGTGDLQMGSMALYPQYTWYTKYIGSYGII